MSHSERQFAWAQDQADSCLPAKGQGGTAYLSVFLDAALVLLKMLTKSDLAKCHCSCDRNM